MAGGPGGAGAFVISLGQAVGLVASTGDGGQSWKDAGLPKGVLAVVDISCPSSTSCYALAFQRPSSGSGTFVLLAYEG
jgi:hypothetical protein